jgi:hypothetical protein
MSLMYDLPHRSPISISDHILSLCLRAHRASVGRARAAPRAAQSQGTSVHFSASVVPEQKAEYRGREYTSHPTRARRMVHFRVLARHHMAFHGGCTFRLCILPIAGSSVTGVDSIALFATARATCFNHQRGERAAVLRIRRFRYIAWVKCPNRVVEKASALRAGSGCQVEIPDRVAGRATAPGAGSDIPKSAYYYYASTGSGPKSSESDASTRASNARVTGPGAAGRRTTTCG